MPMLEAQKHTCFDLPLAGVYQFFDEHKPGWKAFWSEMDGNLDKIVEWAKKAEIEEPESWTNELHKFLFGLYSGDMKLMKKASKPAFSVFLAQVVENHINDPKDKMWYINNGCTYEDFMSALEKALEMPNFQTSIAHLNARVRNLGSRLYDEFLLSQAGYANQLKAMASELRKKAFEIEQEVLGEFEDFEANDKIQHANFPNEEFVVTETVDNIVLVKDALGRDCYIGDVWNLELI